MLREDIYMHVQSRLTLKDIENKIKREKIEMLKYEI